VSGFKPVKLILILILLCVAPFSLGLDAARDHGETAAQATQPTPVVHLRGDYVPDEVLAKLERIKAPRRLLNKCLAGIDYQVKSTIAELQTVVLHVPDGALADAIGSLRQCDV